jgi:DNA mismatch endonuclease (patch repair protein)
MADIVDAATRSRMMSGIRGSHTKPEIHIRRLLHRAGFRFRLHVRNLPGKPDIVLPRFRAVIFVHGCFWHGHDCHLFRLPTTRTGFWRTKIARNKQVDVAAVSGLRQAGWRIAVVWECALKGRTRLPEPAIVEQLTAWLKTSSSALVVAGSKN